MCRAVFLAVAMIAVAVVFNAVGFIFPLALFAYECATAVTAFNKSCVAVAGIT